MRDDDDGDQGVDSSHEAENMDGPNDKMEEGADGSNDEINEDST